MRGDRRAHSLYTIRRRFPVACQAETRFPKVTGARIGMTGAGRPPGNFFRTGNFCGHSKSCEDISQLGPAPWRNRGNLGTIAPLCFRQPLRLRLCPADWHGACNTLPRHRVEVGGERKGRSCARWLASQLTSPDGPGTPPGRTHLPAPLTKAVHSRPAASKGQPARLFYGAVKPHANRPSGTIRTTRPGDNPGTSA